MCSYILQNLDRGIDGILERSNQYKHYLETLDLGLTCFSSKSSGLLKQLVVKNHLCLTNLGLQQCSFEEGELASILSLLPLTHVRVLDISKNTLNLDCFIALANAFLAPKSLLHTVDSSFVRVPIKGHQKCWETLCKALASSQCHVKTFYLDGVINIRFRNSRLVDAFADNSSMVKLTLDQSVFDDESLQKLGSMIRQHRAPKFLSLRNCRIGPREFQQFIKTLSIGELKRPQFGPCFLDLGWNTKLEKNALLHLLPLLRSTGGMPPALDGIGLQGIKFNEFDIPAMLSPENIHQSVLKPESFEHLITLDLSRTGLSTEYIVGMASAFASSWRIGSISLPRRFKPPLKHLNLNNNPFGATGAEAIAEEMSGLESHPMRTLCMSGCHIGQRGSMALVNWLENDLCLTYLELHPQDKYPGFPLHPQETLFHEPLPLRAKLAFLSVIRQHGGSSEVQSKELENTSEIDDVSVVDINLQQDQSVPNTSQETLRRMTLPAETAENIFSFCECPMIRSVQFLVCN